jgi:site-specific DNA recombinase
VAAQVERKKASRRVTITGRAAIYTRVSSNKQSENGASLEAQLVSCRKYCEENGLDIVAEFRDVESGLNTERVNYRKAVDLASRKGIEKLVVWRLDRLGRELAGYTAQLKALRKCGVAVISTTQPNESALMQNLLGVLAEEESRSLSTRVLAAKKHRFENGFWQSAAPLGYKLEKPDGGGRILVPHPLQAPIVKEMFERYAKGKDSLSDLRDFLNENGIQKRSRFSVWYVLRNPVYIGKVMHGKFSKSPFAPRPDMSLAQGQHQPLVSEEVFDKVQLRLSQNASRKRGGTNPKYMFSGLIKCGGCGRAYVGIKKVGENGKPRLQYRCGRKLSVGDCAGHSVYEARVREAVLGPIEILLSALSQEAIRKAVRLEIAREAEAARRETSDAQAGLRATKAKLENRLSKLETAWLDDDIGKDRYLLNREKINDELTVIKRRLLERPAPVQTDVNGLLAIAEGITVSNMDDGAWRQIVEGLVESIQIVGSNHKKQANVKVVWKPGFESIKLLAEAMAS